MTMNCQNCGRKLRANNLSGYCSKTQECRNLKQLFIYHRNKKKKETVVYDVDSLVKYTDIVKTCRRPEGCGQEFRLREDQDEKYTYWCEDCRRRLTAIYNMEQWAKGDTPRHGHGPMRSKPNSL